MKARGFNIVGFIAAAIPVLAQSDGDFVVKTNADGLSVTIVRVNQETGVLNIPSSLDGLKVTGVGVGGPLAYLGESSIFGFPGFCTNLATANWQPAGTNVLRNGVYHFSEPFDLDGPPRFYRIRQP